jgi:hypothetical protein
MGTHFPVCLVLLLAAGCGYESYYPQPVSRTGGRLDSGAGGSLNCSSDEDLASAPRVALTVSNTSGSAVALRYIGPDCQPVVQHTFTFPGEIHQMESFEGAWFDVQDDLGSVLTVWQVPDGVGGVYAREIP